MATLLLLAEPVEALSRAQVQAKKENDHHPPEPAATPPRAAATGQWQKSGFGNSRHLPAESEPRFFGLRSPPSLPLRREPGRAQSSNVRFETRMFQARRRPIDQNHPATGLARCGILAALAASLIHHLNDRGTKQPNLHSARTAIAAVSTRQPSSRSEDCTGRNR